MSLTQNPLYDFDEQFRRLRQISRLAGVDEVGRGPLAGPVVAAAVIFFSTAPHFSVQDSKKLSPSKRRHLFYHIIRHAHVGLGMAEASVIDQVNIYQATRVAMKKALRALPQTPEHILIDGNRTLGIEISEQAVIKGDSQSASIAAASIVAKVFRDEWMDRLDKLYPGYGFSVHKGYPTPAHLKSLKTLGPCPEHRNSFSPVRALSQKELI